MSTIITPVQQALQEFHWDQPGYLVQPSDMMNMLWNWISEANFSHGDLFGFINGILNGLTVTAGSDMQFNIATGRARALGGLKVVQLVTAAGPGQPSSFNTGNGVVNGTGMSSGQTRTDSIYLQYSQTQSQNTNGADIITDTTSIFVNPGTPGNPGSVPAILSDNSYVLLADITVHYNDTVATQATISTTRVTQFQNLVALANLIANNNAVQLNPGSPQSGSISINGNVSVGGYIDYPAISTPTEGAASHYRVYYKSDGNRYVMDPIYGEQIDYPVGVPFQSPNGSLLPGTMWCDGRTNISTTTYARLFGLWGTSYGGDGITTFGVIDLRGVGGPTGPDNFGQGAANRLPSPASTGSKGGSATHSNTIGEMVTHDHGTGVHSHGTTESPHNHLQNAHGHNDTGHPHGVTDGKHKHGPQTEGNAFIAAQTGSQFGYTGPGIFYQEPFTDEQTSNITVNSGNANITNTTATNQSASTGLAVNNSGTIINSSGGGSPYNIMNPYSVGFGWLVRY